MSLYPFTLKLKFHTEHFTIIFKFLPLHLTRSRTLSPKVKRTFILVIISAYFHASSSICRTMFFSQKQTNMNFILSIGTHILNGTDTINRDVQQQEEMFFYNSSCSHQKTVRQEQLASRIGRQMVKILDGIKNRTLLDLLLFLFMVYSSGWSYDGSTSQTGFTILDLEMHQEGTPCA